MITFVRVSRARLRRGGACHAPTAGRRDDEELMSMGAWNWIKYMILICAILLASFWMASYVWSFTIIRARPTQGYMMLAIRGGQCVLVRRRDGTWTTGVSRCILGRTTPGQRRLWPPIGYTERAKGHVEFKLQGWPVLLILFVAVAAFPPRSSKALIACCARCGYQLEGLSSTTCPECGFDLSPLSGTARDPVPLD